MRHIPMAGPVLFGLGNPMLDINAYVEPELLQRYGLIPNNAILAEAHHQALFDELMQKKEHYKVKFVAGGATQNTIRLAQWMMQRKNATVYAGAVGKDDEAKILKAVVEKDGVMVRYFEVDGEPTGKCAVSIINKERSMCTILGAANHYKPEHLQQPELQELIQQAQFFYSSGYFLTVSPPSFQILAEHANKNNKLIAVNLAAPFITQFFKDPLADAIRSSDFVFGNESEAEAYGKANELHDVSPSAVAMHIAGLEKTTSRPRIVVITQGSKQTLVATEGKLTAYEVPPIEPSKIVDDNGAGDSFVGGFISQIVQGKDVATAVRAGHYAARQILQVSGIDTSQLETPNFA